MFTPRPPPAFWTRGNVKTVDGHQVTAGHLLLFPLVHWCCRSNHLFLVIILFVLVPHSHVGSSLFQILVTYLVGTTNSSFWFHIVHDAASLVKLGVDLGGTPALAHAGVADYLNRPPYAYDSYLRDPNEPEVAVDPSDDSPFAVGRMLEVFGGPGNTWRGAIVINHSRGAGAGAAAGNAAGNAAAAASGPLRIKYHFYGMPDRTWDGWLCTEGDADRVRALGAGLAPSAEEQRRAERDQMFRALVLSDGGGGGGNSDKNGSSSRRVIVEMDRDGNCLFRAFAHQVTSERRGHLQAELNISCCLVV